MFIEGSHMYLQCTKNFAPMKKRTESPRILIPYNDICWLPQKNEVQNLPVSKIEGATPF